MKNSFEAFPEVLFIDATYKLNNLRLPVLVILVEDSMGLSEVVAVCLVVNECKETLQWILETFAKNNARSTSIRVVMADKDITERGIVSKTFGVPVLICLFHALKAFKRELLKLKLPQETARRAKECFQKMCYSSNEEEYLSYLNDFEQIGDQPLLNYFDTYWKPCHKDWVRCFKSVCGNYLNSTNNRLESVNGKLKSVIKPYSSMQSFISGFFTVVSSLRNERDSIVSSCVNKVETSPSEDILCRTIESCLTKYASDLVKKELKMSKCNDYKPLKTTGADAISCTCYFQQSMRLPCRHIKHYLITNSAFPIKELSDERWTREYFEKTHRIFFPVPSNVEPSDVQITTTAPKPKVLNQRERYRKASTICQKLASLVTEVGGTVFNERVALLEEISKHWGRNQEYKYLFSKYEIECQFG